MPSPAIRIGVIGCGYWGPNLIRNFDRLDDVEVTWVCDKNEVRLNEVMKEFHLHHAKATIDYQRLLDDPGLDAVAIATHVSSHYLLARDALEAGKHVFVEKPLTRRSEESKHLIMLARQKHCILMVDHTFEFSAPVIRLKEIIDRGEIGNILYINSIRVNLGLFQEDITVLWDLAPHDLSIVNFLLDTTPVKVSAQGMAHIKKDLEDVAFLTAYYGKDIMAHFHISWLDPCKIRRMTLVGDRKMIVYDDMDANEPIRIFDKGVTKQPYFSDYGEFKLHYRFGDVFSPRIDIVEPLKLACSHFVECIQKGIPPRTNGVSGLNVVEIIEAAERSLRNNGIPEPVHCEGKRFYDERCDTVS